MEVKPDVQTKVYDDVAKLLNEHIDVIPPKLPKELPPKREIDHIIYLIPALVPSACPSYHISPLELAELRNQLSKSLNATMIHPSKALLLLIF